MDTIATSNSHKYALLAWYKSYLEGRLQSGNTLIHLDVHGDLRTAYGYIQKATPSLLDIAEFCHQTHEAGYIGTAVQLGLVSSVVWVVPDTDYANYYQTGSRHFVTGFMTDKNSLEYTFCASKAIYSRNAKDPSHIPGYAVSEKTIREFEVMTVPLSQMLPTLEKRGKAESFIVSIDADFFGNNGKSGRAFQGFGYLEKAQQVKTVLERFSNNIHGCTYAYSLGYASDFIGANPNLVTDILFSQKSLESVIAKEEEKVAPPILGVNSFRAEVGQSGGFVELYEGKAYLSAEDLSTAEQEHGLLEWKRTFSKLGFPYDLA